MSDEISRTEYESRQAEMRTEVRALEAQISSLGGKVDTLTVAVASRGLDVWKLLSTSLISVMAGGVLEYFVHIPR